MGTEDFGKKSTAVARLLYKIQRDPLKLDLSIFVTFIKVTRFWSASFFVCEPSSRLLFESQIKMWHIKRDQKL